MGFSHKMGRIVKCGVHSSQFLKAHQHRLHLVCFCLRATLVVLRAYSWVCAQEPFLVEVGWPYRVLRIKFKSTPCKKRTLLLYYSSSSNFYSIWENSGYSHSTIVPCFPEFQTISVYTSLLTFTNKNEHLWASVISR